MFQNAYHGDIHEQQGSIGARVTLMPIMAKAESAEGRHARIIGVACGSGALDHGCADGPDMLRMLGFFGRLKGTNARLRWDRTIPD